LRYAGHKWPKSQVRYYENIQQGMDKIEASPEATQV